MAALDALPDTVGSDGRRGPETVAALRSRADQLRAQLSEEDVAALAQEWQERATERAHELEGSVRERLEDFEPAARQAQIGLWRALRALFGGLAALPALLFRILRAVAGTVDDVVERTDLEERARRAAELLPDRRPPRVRRRTALWWVAGGVGAGFVGGWVLGRRCQDDLRFEEPQPEIVEPLGNGAAPADAAPLE